MAFNMKGSPAKLGTIQGTAGHSSALKMKAEQDAASALKQAIDQDELLKNIDATQKARKDAGESYTKQEGGKTRHMAGDKAWKAADKKSGGSIDELVALRSQIKKSHGGDRKKYRASAEYADIQNKINEAMGSKKVHATTTTKVDDKNTKDTSDDVKTTVPKEEPKGYKTTNITDKEGKTTTKLAKKGLQRTSGKTLTYAQKEVEKKKIAKERADIKAAKESGDKKEKTQSQQEISEIKSGRDDAKTGTVLSRWWHKGRAKRKANKAERLKQKENSPAKQTLFPDSDAAKKMAKGDKLKAYIAHKKKNPKKRNPRKTPVKHTAMPLPGHPLSSNSHNVAHSDHNKGKGPDPHAKKGKDKKKK